MLHQTTEFYMWRRFDLRFYAWESGILPDDWNAPSVGQWQMSAGVAGQNHANHILITNCFAWIYHHCDGNSSTSCDEIDANVDRQNEWETTSSQKSCSLPRIQLNLIKSSAFCSATTIRTLFLLCPVSCSSTKIDILHCLCIQCTSTAARMNRRFFHTNNINWIHRICGARRRQ